MFKNNNIKIRDFELCKSKMKSHVIPRLIIYLNFKK